MTRVVVTGAGGGIGRAFCLHLERTGGYRVVKAYRGDDGREVAPEEWAVDLREPRHVERLMNTRPDVVIHCAGRWNGLNDDYSVLDDNVRMTLNVARYLAPSVSRVVYLSSSAVSRRLKGTYTLAKTVEEQVVQARCSGRVRYAIWRPYHVVSPYETYCPGRSHLVTNLAHLIIDTRAGLIDLRENGRECVRLTWVGDVVAAIMAELDSATTDQVYDIGTTECRTIEEIASCVAEWAVRSGLIDRAPEIVPGIGPSRPCEPYRPDVPCPTEPLESVRRCLMERYADAFV